MSEFRMRAVFLSVALAVLAAGVGLVTVQLRAWPQAVAELGKRLDRLEGLRQIERDLAPYVQAERQVAAGSAAGAAPPAGLVRDVFPAVTSADVRESSRDAAPGWVLQRQEIAVADARLDQVLPLIRRIEVERSPWRLVSIAIRASSQAAGTGHVALAFERPERAPGAPAP